MSETFEGLVRFGREAPDGQVVTSPDGVGMPTTVSIDGSHADVRVGGSGESGDLRMYSSADSLSPTIHIDGAEGDIKLLGGDLAEIFATKQGAPTQPGVVMVVNHDGTVEPCTRPYDNAVVGVVSGAGEERPGVVLRHRPRDGTQVPIALAGRVLCLVDARSVDVEPGDPLTTSAAQGYAMKANDRQRALGASIGKALGALSGRTDLVPILVNPG